MAVILTVTGNPSSYASGAWPAAAFNGGRWRFTFTFTNGSASYAGFHALWGQATGGVWIVAGALKVYRSSDDAEIATRTLTWTAGTAVTFDFDMVARTVTITGALTGNGVVAIGTGNPFNAAQAIGVGNVAGNNTWAIAGTMSNVDDVIASASGSASVGGITSAGSTLPGTFAGGAANVGGVTSAGSAASPGTASGSSAVAGITSSGSASSPGIASGSASVGDISGSGSAVGPTAFGVGVGAAAQSVNSSQPATGTASTAFVARAPSTAYAQNARTTNASGRWHASSGGTTGAGAGPSGSGVQTDGSVTWVGVHGAVPTQVDTAAANNVLVSVLARGRSSTNTTGPSGNKGETFTRLGIAHPYASFPNSATELWVAVNAPGGTDHRWGAVWGDIGSAGDEISLVVMPILTGKATCRIQDHSHVERAAPTGGVVVSASVTTTGRAKLVAIWCGSGTVLTAGTAHLATPQAPFVASNEADTTVSLTGNGYIQLRIATAEVEAPGTYTATWDSNEGAQLYLVAVQESEGALATGSAAVAGITSSGSTATSTVASGSASVGGVAAAGSTSTATSAAGAAQAGGISSSGAASAAAAASGATSAGGISATGGAGVAAGGSASVAGVAASGSAITGTFAAGAAAVGGISSTGATVTPGAAGGTSAVGGIASTGASATGTAASGSAAMGGVASAGIATAAASSSASGSAVVGGVTSAGATISTSATAAGAASVGGIAASGAASSPPSAIERPLPASLTFQVVGAAPFKMSVV